MHHSALVETIESEGITLAMIVNANYRTDTTHFLTPDSFSQQVGFIVYPAGGVIKRHRHLRAPRTLSLTSEVLVVRQGRAIADIYDDNQRLVASREVTAGAVVVLLAGGHGFRMVEPTTFIEIKQGPYQGAQDKVLF